MSCELLIAGFGGEVRAARIEDGSLVDLVVERHSRSSQIGNIYLGRIRRLAPALAAAFVDIAQERDGFLPLAARGDEEFGAERSLPALQEGESVCVQVVRDASRAKGPQLSRRLSLAGARLVYLPAGERIAVSRLIEDENERRRLATAIEAIAAPDEGFIVRTAAEGAPADDLLTDAKYLRARWREIEALRAAATPPALLHREPDALERVLRDHGLAGVDAVRIDGAAAFARAREFCRRFAPAAEQKLSLHRGPSPLFDAYGIENALDEALAARVALPSGGGIVIEATEALVAIDVNSGSLMNPAAPGETALRTNLEAAAEIARQIRLRNIGGMIVVDFISMESETAWQRVLDLLGERLARDRSPSRLLDRTAGGLVEITRRRQRVSIIEALTEICGHCRGSGRVPSTQTIAHATLARLAREAHTAPAGTLAVSAVPEVIAALETIVEGGVAALESTIGRRISLRAVAGGLRENVDIHVAG